ncbi:uncharacterized protein LOC133532477 isoform X2 [Cydia pomonella]|uniref:uncharacterized protein LOC133532477 isoform X2 n=1 Tax=Cydia pomonella TaxID=82600 RepID=UPI002ADE23CF|nr:uncharacterized protein LOC133532477 isoform X2 [Cydia pomonella]XP_061727177.1 uncharacterized protein LOC133532477 isoform X2 [Cydia pomonella]
MVKRTRTNSNDYECIARKVKKLERMLIRARRKRSDRQGSAASLSPSSGSQSSSSSSSSSRSRSASPRPRNRAPSRPRSSQEPIIIEDVPDNEQESSVRVIHPAPVRPTERLATPLQMRAAESPAAPAPPLTRRSAPALLSTSAEPAPTPQLCVAQEVNNSPTSLPLGEPAMDASDAMDLDEDLLKILGDDPSQVRVYGKEIRPDLAVRLQHIATNGLGKDTRKELLDRYLPPANSALIDAPTLNPEVKAGVHEHVFKRDKSIEIRQKQISSAISALSESLTLLLTEQPKNTKLIQLLMDSCKILCDSQHAESLVRRNFILHNLKKELKDELQTTKIDKLLFSHELAEKIKAAKAINKSGDDLKATPSTSGLQAKKNNNNKVPPKNLNWRGPPQNYYRPKGTQRTKEPALKSRRDNSSRKSSHPHHRRSTRR